MFWLLLPHMLFTSATFINYVTTHLLLTVHHQSKKSIHGCNVLVISNLLLSLILKRLQKCSNMWSSYKCSLWWGLVGLSIYLQRFCWHGIHKIWHYIKWITDIIIWGPPIPNTGQFRAFSPVGLQVFGANPQQHQCRLHTENKNMSLAVRRWCQLIMHHATKRTVSVAHSLCFCIKKKCQSVPIQTTSLAVNPLMSFRGGYNSTADLTLSCMLKINACKK